jgi:hypothetical protein
MLNQDDIDWLVQNHPSLHYDGIRITGEINFRMSYNRSTRLYAYPAPASDSLDEDTIFMIDTYQIRIEPAVGGGLTPRCYEDGSRIQATSHNRATSLHDMHVNQGGDFCLATPQELSLEFKNGLSLKAYIEKFVIPFLFLQAHFQRTGEWAWQTAGHGLAGILEWYQSREQKTEEARLLTLGFAKAYKNDVGMDEVLKRLKRGVYKGHMPCLCGEKHKIRNCSKDALCALNELRKDIINLLQSP